uniref:Putative secreted protein n=1 Tax=Panstrongylus lignarius TaxID=156445 RepID=A0A224XV00_9HEMI
MLLIVSVSQFRSSLSCSLLACPSSSSSSSSSVVSSSCFSVSSSKLVRPLHILVATFIISSSQSRLSM